MSNQSDEKSSNKQTGTDWEQLYQDRFDEHLPFNHERQQGHMPLNDERGCVVDFSVGDDDGRRQFIVESKSSELPVEEGWNGDVEQIKDMLEIESDKKTVFLIIPERFHDDPAVKNLETHAAG